MTSINCTLKLAQFPKGTESLMGSQYPDCLGPTLVHQPDERRPDRLLATCESCSAWFLIATSSATMLRLPDDDVLRPSPAASVRPVATLAVRNGR